MAFIQLVTFNLADEEYGIDINVINGIVKSKSYKIKKIPNSPTYLEGIINLRGKVNPVFNLKKKFNLDDDGLNEDSKIIIVNGINSTVGFIVDDVTDIFKVNEEEIEDIHSDIKPSNWKYLKGIAKVEGSMILVLDLVKTLSSEDIAQLETKI